MNGQGQQGACNTFLHTVAYYQQGNLLTSKERVFLLYRGNKRYGFKMYHL